MAGGEASPRQGRFQLVAAHARFDRDRLRYVIDGDDAVHAGEVDDDGVLHGLGPTGAPGRSAARHHRRPRFLGPPKDDRHVLGGLGEGQGDGRRDPVAPAVPKDGQGPPVASVDGELTVVGAHRSPRQRGDQRVQGVHGRRLQPGVGDHASVDGVVGGAGQSCRFIFRHFLDLTQKIEQLLAVPDEVPGRHARCLQDVFEWLPLRPREHRRDEARIEFPAQLDLMSILGPADLGPDGGEVPVAGSQAACGDVFLGGMTGTAPCCLIATRKSVAS